MTFLYPELPSSEAAPTMLGIPDPGPSGEVIRHIIIGSPKGVQDVIYALHLKRYVEQARWTGPMAIGPNGIHITHKEGEMMAYLMRLRSLDVPTG